MLDVITIGDATLDTFLVLDESDSSCTISKDKSLLCLNYAEKTPIEWSTQEVGGNAANVAVGIKKLGFKSAIVSELGEDFAGNIVVQGLEEEGVDTRFVKMLKNKTTRYSIVLNYHSERTILSYHAPRSYSFPQLPETKWVYYTSLGQSFEKVQEKLAKHLGKHSDIRLALNPGSYQFKHGLETVMSLFARTEILFLNKEEAGMVLGKVRGISAMLKAIYELGPKIVVITDSDLGSYAYDGKNSYYMNVYPVVPKAKTGAGDAYASGFLGAIMAGKTIEEAMKWGSANSALVIQEFGAESGLGSRAALQKVIKEYPNVEPEVL